MSSMYFIGASRLPAGSLPVVTQPTNSIDRNRQPRRVFRSLALACSCRSAVEAGLDPFEEPGAHDVGAFGQEVAGAAEGDDLAVAGEHLHDRARLGREELVAVAV